MTVAWIVSGAASSVTHSSVAHVEIGLTAPPADGP